MKTITINGNDYVLEFSFAAAEYSPVVEEMFEMLTMAPVFKNVNQNTLETENDNEMLKAIIAGQIEMTGKIPTIAMDAFYAGLREHHSDISKSEARTLLKEYITETDKDFQDVYEELSLCMENDGFFKLTGIQKKVESMTNATKDKVAEIKKSKTSSKKNPKNKNLSVLEKQSESTESEQ